MDTILRHGDVLLVREDLPKGAKKEFEGKEFVVQEGEVTGHKHRVAVLDRPLTVHTKGSVRYLTFPEEATITHEEHKALTIPPGTYKQGQEREKDWFSLAVRKVVD